jgi:hypothetical protein
MSRDPGTFGTALEIAEYNRVGPRVVFQIENSSTTVHAGRFPNADASSDDSTVNEAPDLEAVTDDAPIVNAEPRPGVRSANPANESRRSPACSRSAA